LASAPPDILNEIWSRIVPYASSLELISAIFLITGGAYAVVRTSWIQYNKPRVKFGTTETAVTIEEGDRKLGFTIEVERNNIPSPQAWYKNRTYPIFLLQGEKVGNIILKPIAEKIEKGDLLLTGNTYVILPFDITIVQQEGPNTYTIVATVKETKTGLAFPSRSRSIPIEIQGKVKPDAFGFDIPPPNIFEATVGIHAGDFKKRKTFNFELSTSFGVQRYPNPVWKFPLDTESIGLGLQEVMRPRGLGKVWWRLRRWWIRRRIRRKSPLVLRAKVLPDDHASSLSHRGEPSLLSLLLQVVIHLVRHRHGHFLHCHITLPAIVSHSNHYKPMRGMLSRAIESCTTHRRFNSWRQDA
jgi:hypothetical protein